MKSSRKGKAKNGKQLTSTSVSPSLDSASAAAQLERLVSPPTEVNHVATMRARVGADLVARLEAEIASDPGAEPKLVMPMSTYVSESVSLACLVERHQRRHDGIGVSLEAFRDLLGGDIGAQIVYLVEELGVADDKLAQGGRAPGTVPVPSRARKVLGTIRAACELAVGKEADDEKGTLVRALRKKHTSRPSTQAALAAALTSYLNAATALAGHLEALPTFPMDMLGEAQTLVDGLLGDSKGTAKQHTRALRLRRNRILSVLQRRVRKAREVGRFAFRDHPEVLRMLASEALRERRVRTAGHAETGETDGGNDTAPR